MKSCRLLHTTFFSSEVRPEPERSMELIESATDVPIMKTNLKREASARNHDKHKQEVHENGNDA